MKKEIKKIKLTDNISYYISDNTIYLFQDEYNFSKLQNLVQVTTKLDNDDAFDFHMKMWIFTHGIATLVATETINFSDEDISNLLSSQYEALMKLEGENKND